MNWFVWSKTIFFSSVVWFSPETNRKLRRFWKGALIHTVKCLEILRWKAERHSVSLERHGLQLFGAETIQAQDLNGGYCPYWNKITCLNKKRYEGGRIAHVPCMIQILTVNMERLGFLPSPSSGLSYFSGGGIGWKQVGHTRTDCIPDCLPSHGKGTWSAASLRDCSRQHPGNSLTLHF